MWHWGDILEKKCRCRLKFIFVFEIITWHFDFEGERQMNFVNDTHWPPQIEVTKTWLHQGQPTKEGAVGSIA